MPWPLHVSAAVQLPQGCKLQARWAAGRKPGQALLSAGAPVASVHVTLLVDLPPAVMCKDCCQLFGSGSDNKKMTQQAMRMHTAGVSLY